MANTFGQDVQSGGQRLRKEDAKAVEKQLVAKTPKMEQWFTAGLAEGYAALSKDFMTNTLPAVRKSMESGERVAVATNLLARVYFLQGETPEDAWRRAVTTLGQEASAGLVEMRRNLLGPRRRGPGRDVFSRIGRADQG